MVTYSMSSAYYALVLGHSAIPEFIFYQILLFRLYLRKFVSNLVIHPQKNMFAKFTAAFSCNYELLTLNVTGKPRLS